MRRAMLAVAVAVVSLFSVAGLGQAGTCSGMTVGQLTSLNGFVPFPGDNLWNTDISALPVDPNSANIINFIGSTVTLHPDFGAGQIKNQTIGIPYQIVAGTQAKVNVTLGLYADESDPGPEPIAANALIEGYPKPGNGDRHVLVLDKDGCWLYELFNASVKNGKWSADQASIWDMTIDDQRPYTWTSADAAGLPVFVGLARYDEVAAGTINHALRFTVPTSQRAFVLPATHWASTNTSTSAPPMGTRLRLKASFNISGFPADDQVILTALKKYGMILADNGSAIFISGAPDDRWNNTNLNLLKSITASNFEVVQQGTIYTPGNVPTGSAPTISSFTANPTSVSSGQPVTLSWSVSSSTYNIITPVGPVRGTSIVVNPTATTTYTLNSTNQFDRSTATVTVTVH
ncbi:MAG TPA: hypothetical protein VL349_03445 [Terriglobales bacterium]|jgi:hypothetical protein|nr:hypothetical protein [Terriglobales bacterium]